MDIRVSLGILLGIFLVGSAVSNKNISDGMKGGIFAGCGIAGLLYLFFGLF